MKKGSGEPYRWSKIAPPSVPPLKHSMSCSGQEISANLFCAKFFENPSGHASLRREPRTSTPRSGLFCGPSDGENPLTPGHPGLLAEVSRFSLVFCWVLVAFGHLLATFWSRIYCTPYADSFCRKVSMHMHACAHCAASVRKSDLSRPYENATCKNNGGSSGDFESL